MKAIVIFMILGIVFSSKATVSHIKINGEIVKYNTHTVLLKQKNGNKIKVPRGSIPISFGKLRSGQKVYALSFDRKMMNQFRQDIVTQEKSKQKGKSKLRKKL